LEVGETEDGGVVLGVLLGDADDIVGAVGEGRRSVVHLEVLDGDVVMEGPGVPA